MAIYEYICLGCEAPFEQRRSIGATVDTALACPACGSERVRRRFSVFSAGAPATGFGGEAPSGSGGCCGGGGCACGH